MPSSPSSAAYLADSLWRFSLALYSRPGVAKALIALQDRDGADISLVLFGLWLGAVRGVALGTLALPDLTAAIEPMRQTAILRAFRRALGTEAFPQIRARVLGVELAAERAAQALLTRFAVSEGPANGDRMAIAAANFAICVRGEKGGPKGDIVIGAVRALARRS